MRFLTGFGLAAAILAGSPAFAAPTIKSSFDSGTEGWALGFKSSPGGTTLPINWDSSNKSVYLTHGWGSAGFVAPSQYLGDKSAYLGGTLSFDLSALAVDYNGRRPLVALTYGSANQQIFLDWGPTPTSTLQNFTVNLTAANFYNGYEAGVTGPVSDAQFASAMSNIKQLLIWGDWTGNVDTVRLDNVQLAGPAAAAVPEPASWAMMIVGFGVVGASVRGARKGKPALRLAAAR